MTPVRPIGARTLALDTIAIILALLLLTLALGVALIALWEVLPA